jgi:hypothetical protein
MSKESDGSHLCAPTDSIHEGKGFAVLSVRQLWAWALIHGGKQIENRCRADGGMPAICRHRGPLLIHASATMKRLAYALAAIWMAEKLRIIVPPLKDICVGGIVGIMDAVGHVTPGRRVCFDKRARAEIDLRWHIPPQYGLILLDPKPLPFVPLNGQLGLFKVGADVLGPEVAALVRDYAEAHRGGR